MLGSASLNLADVWISASVIIGFSSTAFAYRIQRELGVDEQGDETWFPLADRLNLTALVVIIGGVFLLPAIGLPDSTAFAQEALGLGLLLFAGYPFAVVAHYGFHRKRENREVTSTSRDERVVVCVVALLALAYVIAASVGS